MYFRVDDAGSVFGKFRSGFGNGFKHFAENVHSAFLGLFQSFHKDFSCDTGDLHIHLNGGHTFSGTGHFEVHIAEGVFKALNIGKNGNIVVVFNETHRHTGNRRFNGHTGIHQRQCAGAYAAHGSGTVGSDGFGYETESVREGLVRRNHRNEGFFRQSTVTDFAAAGASHGTGFTDAVRREIIVMHITFGFFHAETVQNLFIA